MIAKKLLITGGSGFLASSLIQKAHNWDVFVTRHNSDVADGTSRKILDVDITDYKQIMDAVCAVKPDAVIHTAAIADLALCSSDKQLARRVNVVGTENIAAAAQKCGAKMVFTSTDLVYSGQEGGYSENSPANPSCYYGQTKLEAEAVIASICSDYAISRTALIYGKSLGQKKCFAEVMLEKLQKGEPMSLFSNEYRSPVYLDDLCNALLQMAARDDVQGVYNIGGPEKMSRYQFALILAQIHGIKNPKLTPNKIDQKIFTYHRPEDCSMKITKAQTTFGPIFNSPTQAIQKMKE